MNEIVEKRLTYASPAILARRRRILDETRTLIDEQGIGNFSMNELCKRAGVAKRTLYNAFLTRERLIATAIQEYFLEYSGRRSFDSDFGTLERNLERIAAIGRSDNRIRNYIRATMAVYFSPDIHPAIWKAMHAVAVDSNLGLLHSLQKAGQLQPWVDPDALANDIIRYEYATINDWMRGVVAEDQLIPRLTLSYLTFLAGATREGTRAEIEAMIHEFLDGRGPAYAPRRGLEDKAA